MSFAPVGTGPKALDSRFIKCTGGHDAVIVTYDDGTSVIRCPICLDCFRCDCSV